MQNSEFKILIVDDQPDNLFCLSNLLTKQGYKLQRAISGQLALNAASASPPDLILLDIIMPGIDGYQVCRKLKADSKTQEIPVIFMSALDEASEKVEGFKLGGVDYITKPFEVTEVLARIENQLASQKLQKQLKAQNALLQQEIAIRTQAEEHLRLLESAVVNANDVVVITDASIDKLGPKIVYVNPAFTRMTGYSPAEAIGKTPRILQGQKTDRTQLDKIRHALSYWLSVRTELLNYRKDGSEFWSELEIVPVTNESGILTHWVSVQRDITARKQIEERLRMLESVIVNANDAVMITDAQPIDLPGPKIVYVNPAFTRMTGYRLEEILGKTPRILQSEKTDRTQLDKIRHALSHWQSVRVELINQRKDGFEFWVELEIVPVADKNGSFTHWVSVQRDITARKQAAHSQTNLLSDSLLLNSEDLPTATSPQHSAIST